MNLNHVDRERPADTFTIEEYAREHQVPYRTALERLREMLASGQITRGQYQDLDYRGRICRRNWYRKEPAECPSK